MKGFRQLLLLSRQHDGGGGLEWPSITLTATFISHLLVKVWVDRATEEILPTEPCLSGSKPALWQQSLDVNRFAAVLLLAVFVRRGKNALFCHRETDEVVKYQALCRSGYFHFLLGGSYTMSSC